MILRQLSSHSIKGSALLSKCVEKSQIGRSIRSKSIWKKIDSFWTMFEEKKVIPPYKHCCQIGDPVLRHVAPEVPLEKIKTDEIQNLIKQMKEVLRNYKLVGLAAPQIGVSTRVIVMEGSERLKEKYSPTVYATRQMELLPMTTFINPVLTVKNFNLRTFPEGCASVCGYVGDVSRYEEVLLTGYNENGDAIELHLKGWSARIAQHEIDHLNGQIFVDIMQKKSFTCATWEAINFHEGQVSIPFYPKKWKRKVVFS